MVLEAHPIFRLVPEIAAQLEAVLRGEQAAAGEEVIEKLRADLDICGELGLGQSMGVEEVAEHGSGTVCEWDFVFHEGQWQSVIFTSLAWLPSQRKMMRHWALMRIDWNPARSPRRTNGIIEEILYLPFIATD